MELKEECAEIRKTLKEKYGWSSRKVSVRGSYAGYDTSIHITLKDFSVDEKKVKEVARKYRVERWDEYAQEPLEGGNTWVTVEWDWDLAEKKAEELMPIAKQVHGKVVRELKMFGRSIVAVTGNRVAEIGIGGEGYICLSVVEYEPNRFGRSEYMDSYHTELKANAIARFLTDIVYEKKLVSLESVEKAINMTAKECDEEVGKIFTEVRGNE